MSLAFSLAYLFGYAPWDRWGGQPLQGLRQFFEGEHAIPPGRVLDIGCGMGRAAIYLAQLGWDVVGVDPVKRAIDVASRRAKSAGVQVKLVRSGVADLDHTRVRGRFDLLLDVGCFHILSDTGRLEYSKAVLDLAKPAANLILFAFTPNAQFFGPRGVEQRDLQRYLSPAWHLVYHSVDNNLPYRTPRGAVATWYNFGRAGPK